MRHRGSNPPFSGASIGAAGALRICSSNESSTFALPLLAAEETRRACETVLDLAPHFRRRRPSALGPLDTLGLAAYLDADADGGRERYLRECTESNALLREHFEALLARTCTAIRELTGQPARLSERYALPGFHVFAPFEYARAKIRRPHFDVQYQRLEPAYRWRPGEFARHLTLTMLLAEPPGGAFVEYFAFDFAERLRWNHGVRRALDKLSRSRLSLWQGTAREQTEYRYVPGMLVVTRGIPLHRIGPLRDPSRPGTRVSLQGHALLNADGWELYW
jgi:hypothetical protein